MTESSTAVPASFDAAATLAQISDATAHLLATAAELTDEDLRGPSLCAGWTRGHVLAHIARNADGHANLLNTAATGEVTPMYASDAQRNADIEAGSSRDAATQLADLRESAARFAEAYAAVAMADAWGRGVVRVPGAEPFPAFEVPAKRLGELLIHHVDLDADFTPAHWSDAFTDRWFALTLERFQARDGFPPLRLDVEEEDEVYGVKAAAGDAEVLTVRGPKRALLAWLLGRASGDGLVAALPEGGRGPLPELPSWG
ncbi:maleylpyruvate isomerase family mycothiol-dependent enzyme [Catenulispora yoronensis]|uniref:Maleylpyruvate isomerase family mycothiol-dependent enzyme n=1 Tax=Catenulispora yoronensis TaxID=450799 RepID=A0ABP5FQ53_9ACTN